MLKQRFKRGKARILQKGAGLVEYSLILVLVAVTVIGITAVLGDEVVNIYCNIVLTLAPDVDAPMCETVQVSCVGVNGGDTVSGTIGLEASVVDDSGEITVHYVDWLIDGAHNNTEYNVKYCLGGGDGSCSFNTGSISPGSHNIVAKVVDTDGNTVGGCSVSFNTA